MINSEITSQVSSRMNKIKLDLNILIRKGVERAISEQVSPSIFFLVKLGIMYEPIRT